MGSRNRSGAMLQPCRTPAENGNQSEIMYYEALPLGLEINWDKTKIQGSDFNTANSNPASVSVLGNPVELVESFTILDAELMHAEEVKSEILRRIEIARGCMKSLTKNIWRSAITQSVKIRQYNQGRKSRGGTAPPQKKYRTGGR